MRAKLTLSLFESVLPHHALYDRLLHLCFIVVDNRIERHDVRNARYLRGLGSGAISLQQRLVLVKFIGKQHVILVNTPVISAFNFRHRIFSGRWESRPWLRSHTENPNVTNPQNFGRPFFAAEPYTTVVNLTGIITTGAQATHNSCPWSSLPPHKKVDLSPVSVTSTETWNRELRVEPLWFTLHMEDAHNNSSISVRIWSGNSQFDSISMRWNPFEAVGAVAVKCVAKFSIRTSDAVCGVGSYWLFI